MPVLIAKEVTLAQLRDRFGMARSVDPIFFSEWLTLETNLETNLENAITAAEQVAIDRVQANYLSQLEVQSLNEESVKMVVVSPLLDIAGFYRYPFTIDSEVTIEIKDTDEDNVALTGRIDTLIARDRLWILAIESKRPRFSVQAAVPQALSYLLAKPQVEQPGYALITNGGEFLFIKLLGSQNPVYDFSDTFSLLNRGNDLSKVLAALKQIAASLQDPLLR
jgi:predicted type IV restriction endonuclease